MVGPRSNRFHFSEEVDMTQAIQPHNIKAAATWNAGGEHYDKISHSIADSIEHCVIRLAPRPGERILDVATGTGWTARRVAARGAPDQGSLPAISSGHIPPRTTPRPQGRWARGARSCRSQSADRRPSRGVVSPSPGSPTQRGTVAVARGAPACRVS